MENVTEDNQLPDFGCVNCAAKAFERVVVAAAGHHQAVTLEHFSFAQMQIGDEQGLARVDQQRSVTAQNH